MVSKFLKINGLDKLKNKFDELHQLKNTFGEIGKIKNYNASLKLRPTLVKVTYFETIL